VELLKGLQGLLKHALDIEDVEGVCKSLKKQAEAPAATRLLPAAQPSWGSISAAALKQDRSPSAVAGPEKAP
jgi:hypothetical protein